MATYKVLGQSNPAATTMTSLYTAPGQAVCSTLTACNQDVSTNIRIAVRPGGAALGAANYVVYDTFVNQGDTLWLTVGFTLGATDVVDVYAGHGNVSFNLYGSEV